jgi:Arc/MetJ-type ribon-helix-helix transcriptional regulator
MGKKVEKSVVVSLSVEEISRLEALVGAGAYVTLDDLVGEAVHHWLGEHAPAKPVKNEPVFVLRGHVRDVLGRPIAESETGMPESLESLAGLSAETNSGHSPSA